MRAELVHDRDRRGRWELPLLRSELIAAPFVHGFTTRAGGVSAPPFDTLNLGAKWGDDPAQVSENRRRLERAVGAPIFVARQVHGAGDRTRACRRRSRGDRAGSRRTGSARDAPGLAVGVFVADCVPALVVDPRTGSLRSGSRRLARHGGGRAAGGGRARWRRIRRAPGGPAGRARPGDRPLLLRGRARGRRGVRGAVSRRARARDRVAVAARRGRQGERRSQGREPPAARTGRRRARGDRRGPRVHALRSRAFLLVSPRRRRDRPVDGRRRPRRASDGAASAERAPRR